MRILVFSIFVATLAIQVSAEEAETYLLAPELKVGDRWVATVDLEVGGDMLTDESTPAEKLPVAVHGKLRYEECLVGWSQDDVARSVRLYEIAEAKIQVEEGGLVRQLPVDSELVVAEIRDQKAALNGVHAPLTRDQMDLVNVVANTLALHRLLPEGALAEGDSWDHSADAIGPLLGLDYLAACEVSSVVTGVEHNQVKLRLAGTVHGTIDGAPTEMDLRGAYLFHLDKKRITKFNFAIKEIRTASKVVPGLDIVAKVKLTLEPVSKSTNITAAQIKLIDDLTRPIGRELQFNAADTKGFRFRHDKAWYVTADQRELVSLRYLQENELVAHCNISTLPARSAGRFTTLEQFEREVRSTLGDNLDSVAASTQWTNDQGYECLGVVAIGTVEDVAIEWRYYLISSANLPRVSVAVTVEQGKLKQFNDADRQLVDSLELLAQPATDTAAKPAQQVSR